MRSADLPLLGLLAALFLLAVFLAAAETALIRISPVRARSLAETGSRGAARLVPLLDDLPSVLNGILLSALLVQVGAATVTGVLAQRWFGSVGVTVGSVVLTVLLFVYTEAIPKTYTVRHTDRVATLVAAPVAVLELVLRPIVGVLVWFADLQLPGKGITTSPTVTEDELRRLASRAAREGQITHDDRVLIERAFRLGDRRADDLMVPRADVVAVEAETPISEARQVALGAGHRRLPVYEGDLEQVVGVVRLRDLVSAEDTGASVRSQMQPALVVPETKRVVELLREMQQSGNHLAMVVDEYGAIAGLVTVEDIASELLGSISEEPPSAPVNRLGPERWSIDATLPIEDLSELLEVEVPEGDFNTVAGLVLSLLGRLPQRGEEVELDGHRITVTEIRRRRILRVEVSRQTDQPSS